MESSEINYIHSNLSRYIKTLDFIKGYLQNEPLNMLDFGTGGGWMAMMLKKLFPMYNITACDQQILERVRSRLEGFKIHTVDNCTISHYAKLPFEEKSFNICLFLEVFEHVIEDPRDILGELHRIIANDGILFLTTPNLAHLFNRLLLLMGKQPQLYLTGFRNKLEPRGHFREWTLEELVFLLSENGFQVIYKGYMDAVGSEGMVSERPSLRALYYPYKVLTRIRPNLRSQLAIVCKRY